MRVFLVSLVVARMNGSTMVIFQTHDIHPLFPYHVAFDVHVQCLKNTIKHTFVDEGSATSVMYLDCWKGLGSSVLSKYMTILASFDGPSIRLHHVIPRLLV